MTVDWVPLRTIENAVIAYVNSPESAHQIISGILINKEIRSIAKYFEIESEDGRVRRFFGREIESEFWINGKWNRREKSYVSKGTYEERFEAQLPSPDELGDLQSTYRATGVQLCIQDIQRELPWLKLPLKKVVPLPQLAPSWKGVGGRPPKREWSRAAAFLGAYSAQNGRPGRPADLKKILDAWFMRESGASPDAKSLGEFVNVFWEEWDRAQGN